jgi:4-amino-4-deoxy-L-arabinose transferase-like glycosyltransferase
MRPYLLVLALALAVRIAWALMTPVQPISDCSAYDTFARNLAAGECYGFVPGAPSAFWPVGTGFMYSLVYRAFHPDVWGYTPVVCLNTIIGLGNVALTMLMARRWFGRPVAIVAGLALALWPVHVQFTTVLASEGIFTALCLAGICLWPPAAERGRRSALLLVLSASAFALATYVRPTALLLPALLAGIQFLRDRRLGPAVARVAVSAAVIAVIIAPWSARNTRLFGRLVLVSCNGGSNLWMGNNPASTGMTMDIPPRPLGLNEAEWDAELGRRAKRYILEHPVAFVERTVSKAVRLYDRETIGIAWNPGLAERMPERAVMAMKWSSQVFWMAALLAGVCGAVMLAGAKGVWFALTHPAVAIWAYFTLVHAVIVVQDRYHFPVTPMIAALAALALVNAYTWGARLIAGREGGAA